MNMMCVSIDFSHRAKRVGGLVEMRPVPAPVRPANRPALRDPHQRVGSFVEMAPEDRDELLGLLEEAFARI